MKHTILFGVAMMLFISACGSSGPVFNNYSNDQLITGTLDGVPLWIETFPRDDENGFYEVSQARSSNSTQGEREARNAARTQMAQKIETKVQVIEKAWNESVTQGDSQNTSSTFEQVGKQITDQSLQLVSIRDVYCTDIPMNDRTEGGNIDTICYAVAEMVVGDARQNIDNALSRDQELYTKFKSSKAFQEFEKQFPVGQ